MGVRESSGATAGSFCAAADGIACAHAGKSPQAMIAKISKSAFI
jgi:hypothetical protein